MSRISDGKHMADTICPIWGTPATTLDGYQNRDGEAVHSERAGGSYFISRTAKAVLAGLSDIQKVALTNEICDHNTLGSVIEISSVTLDALPSRPNFPAPERADRLLRSLITRSKHLGKVIHFQRDADDNRNSHIAYLSSYPGKTYF